LDGSISIDTCENTITQKIDNPVKIEIIQLDLVSCDPITVTVDEEPLWEVEVTLSDQQQPGIASLTMTKSHCDGGTFHSDFGILPEFTFAGD